MAKNEANQFGDLFETVKNPAALESLEAARETVEMVGPLWEAVRQATGWHSEDEYKITRRTLSSVGYSNSLQNGAHNMKRFVSYLRVSTRAQGASGLGLAAQKQAVDTYARSTGGKIVREFVEVESGKKTALERPELASAMAYAKRAGAVLVVAKLDRLARNIHFLSGLMEGGVDFVACDNPNANRLTIHILCAVAQWEREAISTRTKEALARAKSQGKQLGSARPGHWDGREDARLQGGLKGLQKAHKVISDRARTEYADLLPIIKEMRQQGKSLADVAAAMNESGHTTRTGKQFHASQIQNILRRG